MAESGDAAGEPPAPFDVEKIETVTSPPAPVDLAKVSVTPSVKRDTVESPTSVQPFDPAPVQEQTRGWIAYALLAALFVVVIFLMIAGAIVAKGCYYSTDACAASKSTLEILTTITGLVFTPLVGLVGSVVGFYFGSKAGGNRG